MAAEHQLQNLLRPCSIALALCLLSVLAVQSNSQNAQPSEHGLMYQKNPGDASSDMVAFFGRPKAELPEAQNVSSDPVWRAATKVVPGDPPARSGGHARPTLLITGIVFAVLGVGLLATAVVAYMLHARRSRSAWSSSTSSAGFTHWRNYPEVQLGAV